MKYMKRVFAFLLAIMLCLTPVSTVYADSHVMSAPNDSSSGEVATDPTEGETEPTEGETEPTKGETEPTEGETTPTEGETTPTEGEEVSEIEISFSYDAEVSESGWYLESKDLVVVFSNTIGFETITLSYEKGTEEPISISPEVQEDGSYKGVISGISDGEYLVTAYAKGTDGVESTKTLEFKLDTTPVDYSNISAEGVTVQEGIGYAQDSYVITGLSDSTSGIKSVIMKGVDGVLNEYTEGGSIVITEEVSSVALSDVAGNVLELPIDTLISSVCSSVVFDSNIPSISILGDSEADYDNGGQKYYKDSLTVTVIASDDNLKEVIVYINGQPMGTSAILEKEVTLAYKLEESGTYVIDVVVKDKSGNEISKSETYNIDKEPPLKGTISLDGEWTEANGNVYTKSSLSITGAAEDTLSGYNKVEVLKDSTVVGTSLPYVITESGRYSVRVYDNVGNVSEFFVSDLVETSGNYIVVDKELPLVSVESVSEPDYTGSRGYWYSSKPIISVSASDSNIKSVVVSLEADGVKTEVFSGNEDVTEFLVDTSDYEGNLFKITVLAEDLSGNTSSVDYEFNVDSSAPESVTVEADTPSAEKGGNVYYSSAFDVVISANDTGFGDIVYYLDDIGNKTGKFYGVGAGEHTVRVEDGLGNTTLEIPLSEYLGWGGNNVVIVSNPATISATGFAGSWVGSTPSYIVSVEDEAGIDSYTVYVNDEVVSEESFKVLDKTSALINFDLSGVKPSVDGVYSVRVLVTNNAGLSNEWSDVVKIDTTLPTLGSIAVDGDWKEVDGNVYSNKAILISGEAFDAHSGVASVEVLNGDEVVSNVLPYSISSSGSYRIVITDSVGNSNSYNLNEILGTSSNTIVIDEEVPSLSFDSKTTSPDAVVNGVNWYSTAPTITVRASDNNKIEVNIIVEIDGVEHKEYSGSANGELLYDVDTSKYSGDSYTVHVTASDDSGNNCSLTYSFSVDSEKPGIGSLGIVSEFSDFEDGAYSNSGFIFSGSAVDSGSGISSIIVYKDGASCYEATNGSVGFSISSEAESGLYYIVVTDMVGNESVFHANELLGSKASMLVVDKTIPAITRTDSGLETSKGWYNYIPGLSFSIVDDYIDSYTVSVNGSTVKAGTVAEEFSLDMSAYTNMPVKVEIVAVDKAGNPSTYVYEYTHDNTPPEGISATSDTAYSEKNGFVYFNEDLVLSVSASDSGYSELTYYLNDESNKTGDFSISADGEYFVKVVDGLGNESEKISLKDLLGWEFNSIVFDSDKPVVSANKYNSQWVSAPPVYNFTFSDNSGIDSIVVSVNNTEVVNTKYPETDVVSESFPVDLSHIVANKDGAYNIVATVRDNSGSVSVWSDIVYVDSVAPEISKFEIQGATAGNGATINGEDTYGFFFNGSGSIVVLAEDTGASSGIEYIWTRFEGEDWVKHSLGSGNSVSVSIPENFKGKFEAYAVDKVGNAGSTNFPDLLVSETEDTHNANSDLVISLQDTPYTDINGLPLYNSDVSIEVFAGCYTSGIKGMQWGLNELSESIESLNGVSFDKNLVTSISKVLGVVGNENNMRVVVKVTDMVGHTSEESKLFSIDMDKPIIEVTFDKTTENGYYNSSRTATIKVTERNFNPELFNISGTYGELGDWSNVGDVWTNTIVFSDNNEYKFTINCTDRAGNSSVPYVSETFFIDKTKPVINRVDTDEETASGWYNYIPEFKFNVVEDYISLYEVYINDSLVKEGVASEIAVDTSKYQNTGVSIRVRVTDKAGNFSEWSYSYGHDNTPPRNVSVKVHTPVSQKGGVVYFNGQFDITISADDGNGYGDLTYYLNDESNKTGKFTIRESGEYFIKVTDGLGHVYGQVSLGSLCGWTGNSIVINNIAPTIEFEKFNGTWLSDTCVYSVTSGSVVGLNSVVATVNGVEVVNKVYEGIDILEDLVEVDISKAEISEDSSYRLEITVVDNSGLVTTSEDVVYVDTHVPEMGSLGVEGSWEIHDGKLYANSAIVLKGYPSDPESGIKTVEVLKDGNVVGTLPYSIVESGKYEVRVTDNVGNLVVYSFADIANVSTSDIVWDDSLPVVYFDMNQSDKYQYFDGSTYWYATNPVIYIGMTDDNMESVSVSVTIDGSETIVVNDILEEGIYAIDTSYSPGTEFKIVATATDKSGNVSESFYEFSVDTEKPLIGTLGAAVSPEYKEDGGYVYIRGQFTVSGSPIDNKSGVKIITVYKDGDVFATSDTGVIDVVVDKENLSGSYSVSVEDNVGNVYTVALSDLLGTKSNNFIIDLTSPVISRIDSNLEIKEGWFNYAPVFTFDISDDFINDYTVYINGNEVAYGIASEVIDVPTSDYKNQKVSVKVVVRDKAGNTDEYIYSYQEDSSCPVNVQVEMSQPVSHKGENVYYNSIVNLVVTAEDGDGFGSISYYINGERVENGVYSIVQSGEYSIEVVDGLGNTTGIITLKDFFNWSGNNIVLDGSRPVVTGNEYNGSWISGIGSYSIKISDNIGIDRVTATVNDVNVIDVSVESTTETERTISFSTEGIPLKEDGSYSVSIIVVDNSGLSTTWEDVVYVDNTSPYVDSFIMHGDVNKLNTDSGYGYFFNGSGVVEVVCLDNSHSSGIKSIWTKFEGQNWVEHPVTDSGIVSISVPENFKGKLEAYVVDKVGNVSDVKSPALLISETANGHEKNHTLKITLPNTEYKDSNGLPLYNKDFVAELSVGCDWSGLKSVLWGVYDMTEVTDFTGGVYEENIVTMYSQKAPVYGNENGMSLSVTATDMSGNSFTGYASFSIDKDVPVIRVSYNTNLPEGYYNETRVATITVNERNFNPDSFTVSGNSGVLGEWSNYGDVWENTMSFYEDGDYQFTLNCTDMAGNVATQYVSEEFTIDKTAPIMTVSWNTTSPSNEMYYNEARTATVTVIEHNFDSSLFSLNGSGSLLGWSTNGDTHTATIHFDSDGEYEFSISGSDKAGNATNEPYSSGKFVVDLTAPVIEFSHITEGVSYKDNVEFVVNVYDTYINSDTRVYLSGKLHEEVEITGQFVGQSGIFSYTDFPIEEDVDDIYTIRVVAVDNAGNVTEDTLMFSVNRFGSSYSFYNAEYLNNYHSMPEDITICEVNVDRLDINKVVVSITKDGKKVEVLDSWVSISEEEVNGKFLYTYTISKDAFAEDGKYSVSILSQAEEGTQYTSASEQYDFVVDKSSPVVIISGIEDGETYHEYERTVSVDVRDLSGVSHIEFIVNGEVVEDYSKTDDIYYFTVGESPEYQSVVVRVVDMAGNSSMVRVDDFLITSNLMVYLINQLWFLVIVAFVLFLIVTMVIMLLLSRRKEKDEEQKALKASGELYKSSTSGNSSGSDGTTGNGGRILSGDIPTYDQGTVVTNSTTSFSEEDTSDLKPTGTFEDATTGIMEDSNEKDTGVMD